MRPAAAGLAPDIDETLPHPALQDGVQGVQQFGVAPREKIVQGGRDIGGNIEQELFHMYCFIRGVLRLFQVKWQAEKVMLPSPLPSPARGRTRKECPRRDWRQSRSIRREGGRSVAMRLSRFNRKRDYNLSQPTSLSYRDAGVDIDAGDALVENIKPFAKRTMRPEVLGGLGGFGAMFEIGKKYQNPVLVSGTDGVGTKLKLAFMTGKHDTVGIDLVAMSVNDILVQGAEPLFFLDYFACGKLDVATATDVIKGIAAGCEQAGCALIGGETAEMPGMYPAGEYDLAGFAVGAVEKDKIITGKTIVTGDVVLGLASSGAHSNGYSLVRKIIERTGIDHSDFRGLRRLRVWRWRRSRESMLRPLLEPRRTPGQGHGPHYRRRPAGKHPARAAAAPGRNTGQVQLAHVRRCSPGCSRKATWPKRKCTAPSTAASAWWSSSLRNTQTRQWPR